MSPNYALQELCTEKRKRALAQRTYTQFSARGRRAEPYRSKGLQQQLLCQHAPDVIGQLQEAIKDKRGSAVCVTGCICSLACAECLQSCLQAMPMLHIHNTNGTHQEKKRKDYAFQRQFNERPSVIPGCPGRYTSTQALFIVNLTTEEWLQDRAKHLPESDLQAELMVC